METKICKRCGRELPIEEFYKDKTYKDGHRKECKECSMQRQKQYYQDNKETISEYQKQYRQEHKEELAEQKKQYYQDNKETISEYQKQWYQDNREDVLEQQKQWYQTPFGRASYLVNSHRREDKKYNRGECTLTAQWIIDNIFNSKCIYCGESDWTKLGCDRIDNSLPHTPDNVNPCCEECNKKRGKKTYEEYMKKVGK